MGYKSNGKCGRVRWGGERTNSSSSGVAESQGAKLLAPSKHELLALGWGQEAVTLVLQAPHTGHLHREWAHTVRVTEQGATGVEAGRCQKSHKNQRLEGMGTGQ